MKKEIKKVPAPPVDVRKLDRLEIDLVAGAVPPDAFYKWTPEQAAEYSKWWRKHPILA